MICSFTNSVQISLIQTLKSIAFSWTIRWYLWQNVLMINEKNKFLTGSWLSGLLSAEIFISTGEWVGGPDANTSLVMLRHSLWVKFVKFSYLATLFGSFLWKFDTPVGVKIHPVYSPYNVSGRSAPPPPHLIACCYKATGLFWIRAFQASVNQYMIHDICFHFFTFVF